MRIFTSFSDPYTPDMLMGCRRCHLDVYCRWAGTLIVFNDMDDATENDQRNSLLLSDCRVEFPLYPYLFIPLVLHALRKVIGLA